VTEKLHASADVLQRTVVVAPVSGTVVDVKFKTVGGVVRRASVSVSMTFVATHGVGDFLSGYSLSGLASPSVHGLLRSKPTAWVAIGRAPQAQSRAASLRRTSQSEAASRA
jgi:hypothetical protein